MNQQEALIMLLKKKIYLFVFIHHKVKEGKEGLPSGPSSRELLLEIGRKFK